MTALPSPALRTAFALLALCAWQARAEPPSRAVAAEGGAVPTLTYLANEGVLIAALARELPGAVVVGTPGESRVVEPRSRRVTHPAQDTRDR